MFESIQHNKYSDVELTCASYQADGVYGSISFSANGKRCTVISSIGPSEAIRQCSTSHFLGEFSGKLRARADEEVHDFS